MEGFQVLKLDPAIQRLPVLEVFASLCHPSKSETGVMREIRAN